MCVCVVATDGDVYSLIPHGEHDVDLGLLLHATRGGEHPVRAKEGAPADGALAGALAGAGPDDGVVRELLRARQLAALLGVLGRGRLPVCVVILGVGLLRAPKDPKGIRKTTPVITLPSLPRPQPSFAPLPFLISTMQPPIHRS